MTYLVGIDIGGTFTDRAIVDRTLVDFELRRG